MGWTGQPGGACQFRPATLVGSPKTAQSWGASPGPFTAPQSEGDKWDMRGDPIWSLPAPVPAATPNSQIRLVTGPSASRSLQGREVVLQSVPGPPGEGGAERPQGRGARRTLLAEPFKEPARSGRTGGRRRRRRGAGEAAGSGPEGPGTPLPPPAAEPSPKTAGPGRNRRAGSSPSLPCPPARRKWSVLVSPSAEAGTAPQTFRVREPSWRRRRMVPKWGRGAALRPRGFASALSLLKLVLTLPQQGQPSLSGSRVPPVVSTPFLALPWCEPRTSPPSSPPLCESPPGSRPSSKGRFHRRSQPAELFPVRATRLLSALSPPQKAPPVHASGFSLSVSFSEVFPGPPI